MGSVMETLPFRVEKAEGVFVVFKKELAHFVGSGGLRTWIFALCAVFEH